MSNPNLVRDNNGGAVQALLPDTTVSGASSGSSSRLALPTSTSLVRLASSVDVYVELGGAGVNATSSSMLFPAGAEVFSVFPASITHVAFLLVGATPGVFSATKMV
ncbi:MAG TPA: hypothetical protein V6D20_18065 [Candidatus Obscuribacterales bacterium]